MDFSFPKCNKIKYHTARNGSIEDGVDGGGDSNQAALHWEMYEIKLALIGCTVKCVCVSVCVGVCEYV